MSALGSEVLEFLVRPTRRADPYPFYRRVQELQPVHSTPFGLWLVSRHADAVAVLREPRLSSDLGDVVGNPGALVRTSPRLFVALARYAGVGMVAQLPVLARVGLAGLRAPKGGAFAHLARRTLLLRDPPDHTRLRRLVSRAFTPRVVDALRPRIEDLVDRLLWEAAADDGCDFMARFAYPLPVSVVCELLGVPSDDHGRLLAWSEHAVVGLDPVQALLDPAAARRADAAALAMSSYLAGLVDERRRSGGGDDLVGRLVAAGDDGDDLTDEEIVVMCALLIIAGHETTANLIGNGLVALLRHPAARERWLAEPELAATAVEELLRYDSPVQTVSRRAVEPLDIGGRHIPAGSIVMGLTGAANRDPEVFDDPDALVLDRAPNPHLAFGGGIHYCLGAALARAEAAIALPAVLRRGPRMLVDEPAWRPTLAIRGLRSLPLTFST